MNRCLLIVSFLSIAIFGSSQQLPNAGFENWSSGSPNGWGNADDMLGGSGLVSGTTLETQVSPGNSGNSACKLQTQSVNLLLIGAITVPGIVNSGTLSLDLASGAPVFGRIPFTAMPTDFTFFYKYAPVNGDTAAVLCYFTKWNTATNSRDTIGGGGTFINGTVSSFTQMSVPITWLTGAPSPDSVQMFFISSAGVAPQINTSLIIDDVNMVLPIGVSESYKSNDISIYPNPATDVVNFSSKNDQPVSVDIFDFVGKKVASQSFKNGKVSFSVSELPSGVYMYTILDSEGLEVKSGKFSVSK